MRGFKEILDGKHDSVPEGNFYMKGGIEEIQAGLRAEAHGRDAETGNRHAGGGRLHEDVHMVTLPVRRRARSASTRCTSR